MTSLRLDISTGAAVESGTGRHLETGGRVEEAAEVRPQVADGGVSEKVPLRAPAK